MDFLVEFICFTHILITVINETDFFICLSILFHFHSEVLTFILSCMSIFAIMSLFKRFLHPNIIKIFSYMIFVWLYCSAKFLHPSGMYLGTVSVKD